MESRSRANLALCPPPALEKVSARQYRGFLNKNKVLIWSVEGLVSCFEYPILTCRADVSALREEWQLIASPIGSLVNHRHVSPGQQYVLLTLAVLRTCSSVFHISLKTKLCVFSSIMVGYINACILIMSLLTSVADAIDLYDGHHYSRPPQEEVRMLQRERTDSIMTQVTVSSTCDVTIMLGS